MAITISLPHNIEEWLRREYPDLEGAAKESLVIEAYRTGRLSLGAVAESLGLPTTIAAQEWLAQRGIPLNYGPEDFADDLRTLHKIFPGRR